MAFDMHAVMVMMMQPQHCRATVDILCSSPGLLFHPPFLEAETVRGCVFPSMLPPARFQGLGIVRDCWTSKHLHISSLRVWAGAVAAASNPDVADVIAAPFERAWDEVGRAMPACHSHPRFTLAAALATTGASIWYYRRCVACHMCLQFCAFKFRLYTSSLLPVPQCFATAQLLQGSICRHPMADALSGSSFSNSASSCRLQQCSHRNCSSSPQWYCSPASVTGQEALPTCTSH